MSHSYGSAAQPAHTSSSSSGITWVYFNLWDSVDVDDKAAPNIVVLTTRRLHHEEETRLVKYFCRFGVKRLPSGLPYADKGEIYSLSARAMKIMHKLAADNKEVESVAIRTMVPADSCTMHVKRMTVTGKEELTVLCERAYQKLASRNAAMALSSGSAAQPADQLASASYTQLRMLYLRFLKSADLSSSSFTSLEYKALAFW